ncbi:MAG: hypothetical protein AAF577_03820, partial [Pseudomonadota bacterium]
RTVTPRSVTSFTASSLNSRLTFRFVISTPQLLGHGLIVVSTEPAAGYRALAVHDQTLAPEHGVQAERAVAAVLRSQRAHPLQQGRVIALDRSILMHRSRETDNPAGAPLAQSKLGHGKAHGFALCHGPTSVLQAFLHARHVEHLIGDDPLQPRILGLEIKDLLCIRRRHAPKLLPLGTRHVADEMPCLLQSSSTFAPFGVALEPVALSRLTVLFQDCDDLRVAEPAALHGTSSFVHSKVQNPSPQSPGYRRDGQ